MSWKGMDDCRPKSMKPKPGKTDCTSNGRTSTAKSQNVSPFADRSQVNSGFKGQPDSRPNCGKRKSSY